MPSRDVHSTSEAMRGSRLSRERHRIESRCRRPVPDGDLNTEDGRSSDFVRSTFPTISSVAEAITLF